MALEDRPRIKYRIAADGNGRIDISIMGSMIETPSAMAAEAYDGAKFGFGHLLAGIDAQRFRHKAGAAKALTMWPDDTSMPMISVR